MAKNKKVKVTEAPKVEVTETEVATQEAEAVQKAAEAAAAQKAALEKANKPQLSRFILSLPPERSKAWYIRQALAAGYSEDNIDKVLRNKNG